MTLSSSLSLTCAVLVFFDRRRRRRCHLGRVHEGVSFVVAIDIGGGNCRLVNHVCHRIEDFKDD